MVRYWSINTAATAVPLSAHPFSLAITTKLAVAILGRGLFGGGVLPAQYCHCAVDTQNTQRKLCVFVSESSKSSTRCVRFPSSLLSGKN